ncbi:pimeloyl-ACP methyl ester carboxylesterase [Catenisphaera adipataccumulans]|uniref:Pimeloyl-ACP methyl ester carboxylesterase n=1 Tax=Catenisphaera adipataccumulans TaxID=700500 RepID=A0A7W8CV10_9FIRM|nr:pimeloyl-ACP methyl ester carboxylesterase [Catenisphaera adipataccumulans]
MAAKDTKSFIALNQKLLDHAMNIDVRKYGMKYQVPVGFISGSQDWTTPAECTQSYYDSIAAPAKQIKFIDGCGHYPQYEDTDIFCKTLRNMLEDLTTDIIHTKCPTHFSERQECSRCI